MTLTPTRPPQSTGARCAACPGSWQYRLTHRADTHNMEPSSVGWQVGGPVSKRQRPLGSSQQSMRSFLSRPAPKPQGPPVPCTTSQAQAACSTVQPGTSTSPEPGPHAAAGGKPAAVSPAAQPPDGADLPAPAPAGQPLLSGSNGRWRCPMSEHLLACCLPAVVQHAHLPLPASTSGLLDPHTRYFVCTLGSCPCRWLAAGI